MNPGPVNTDLLERMKVRDGQELQTAEDIKEALKHAPKGRRNDDPPIMHMINDRHLLLEHARLHPRDEWSEDDGYVLWYRVPINEPPYVGTPNSSDWPEEDHEQFYGEPRLGPGYYTHWQRLPPLPKDAGEHS